MARLYLDEHLDIAMKDVLAGYGHDTIHTYDVGNRGTPVNAALSVC